MARVPFVGLTGGLGSGKSEALRALGELGAATLSTDAVVHELLGSDELREIVVERLGEEVAPGGVLERSRIAERVFGDEEARKWLEAELWPRVGQRVAEWRQDVDALDPPPRTVVTTMGAHGGRWEGEAGSGTWESEPLPGPRVDAYGAGDSFAAGLTTGLAAGLPIEQAVRLGARCGAANMTGRGPYAGQLDLR